MKRYTYTIIWLLVIHLILLAVFAGNRIVDADEGFYTSATRMVSLGMSPYTDFFYTQLMMMPSLFSPFADDGWQSFFVLRGFAVLAGFLSALLLTAIVLKTTKDIRSTVIAVFMYALSGMTLIWHSTYKPLPFSHFLTLGTFFFWLLFQEKRNLLYLIFSGLFLSALINFRAVFVVLLPLYFLSAVYLSKGKRAKNLIAFTLSLIPFAIPTFLKILESADHFFYNNLMFQLYRESERSIGFVLSNRFMTYLKAALDPHLLIIFILTVVSLWLLFRQKRISFTRDLLVKPEGMAVMNLVLIAGVYLLPHPILRQYIDQYLAFAIIVSAFSFKYILTLLDSLRLNLKRAAMIVFAGLYVLSLIPYVAIFIYGIREYDHRYRLSEVRKVTDTMQSLAQQSDTVLTEWTGYAFLTKQTPVRYTEIISTEEYRLPLSHEEFMHYNLCDGIYLRNEVSRKSPKLVVTINQPAQYYAAALAENYDKTFQSDVVSIYKRK